MKTINSVNDYLKYIDSTKTINATDILKATKRLTDIYGEKIIPGCALDEELNEEEKFARVAYASAHQLLKEKGGEDLKNLDNLYETVVGSKFKLKRFLPKLFFGILILMVFLALFKYVFS